MELQCIELYIEAPVRLYSEVTYTHHTIFSHLLNHDPVRFREESDIEHPCIVRYVKDSHTTFLKINLDIASPRGQYVLLGSNCFSFAIANVCNRQYVADAFRIENIHFVIIF